MAAFESKTSIFAARTTVGAQAITGLGFQPKALVLVVLDDGVTGTGYTSRTRGCMGISDGVNSRVAAWAAGQASGATAAGRGWHGSRVVYTISSGGVTLQAATLTSFDADGFTLNWSAVTGVGTLVAYWAIGGTDVDAKVIEWTLPTVDGDHAVTGVGFQPEFTIHTSALLTAAGTADTAAFQMIGACDRTLGQAVLCPCDDDNETVSNSRTYTSNVHSIGAAGVATGTVLFAGEQTSMDPDGFSFDFDGATVAYKVATLAIRGVQAKVGRLKKPKTALGNQVVTGVGFRPESIVAMWNTQATPPNWTPGTAAVIDDWSLGIGATTDAAGAVRASGFSYRTHHANPAGPGGEIFGYINAHSIVTSGHTGDVGDIAQGDITSFNPDGFTVNWVDQNPIDPWIFYMAITGNRPPTAPTLHAPTGGATINLAVSQRFDWTFNDPDSGDTQSKYSFQYRAVGDPFFTTVIVTSPTPHHDLPAGTLMAGDYEWRVRTYDAIGTAGPYSSIATFTAVEPPDVPTITYPANAGTVSIEEDLVVWSDPEQEAYEARRVADDAGDPDPDTVYETSGEIESPTARQHLLHFTVNDRTEHVQVRVRNDGLWGDWATVIVDVAYTPPATPTITVDADHPTGAISIQATHPEPDEDQPAVGHIDIWRRLLADVDDGIRIAADLPPDDPHVDWSVAHGTEYAYRARAFGANGTTSWSEWSEGGPDDDVIAELDGGEPDSDFDDDADGGGP